MKGLLFMFMLLFCCCALADSFKFNCCLWNIHSDFLTLLLSCPGGAGAREGGALALRRIKCTEKCGGKLLQLVIKCKSPDKECCTLPELWAAQAKGATRSSARSCQTVSQVNRRQAGRPAELILIPVAASHGNVFCCSHCGYKKCLFHVFKSRHVVALRCLLGFCFCFFNFFWFSASKMLRSLQTDTRTHTHTLSSALNLIYL